MLLFKKKFLDAIRSGRKTQTIRLWKACRLRTGGLCYIPGVGYTRVTDIAVVKLEELTDEDAQLDGFDSAAALLHEINHLYADRVRDGYRAYRIRFQVMTAAEAAEVRARKQARSADGSPNKNAAAPKSAKSFRSGASRQNPA